MWRLDSSLVGAFYPRFRSFRFLLPVSASPPLYVATPYMAKTALTSEMKKGSAELLILAILEDGQRHGYEIARQIERRSRGAISFHVASLYPMLYRLEARSLIEGRWVEKAGQRRRRYYRLTAEGAEVLAAQRSLWQEFFIGINRVARLRTAST